jgi:hypothetical protein
MRVLIAALAVVFGCAEVSPVIAASQSIIFTVSATVVSSCTIDFTRILSRLLSARTDVICSPAAGTPPQPTVTVTRDAAGGNAALTIEFLGIRGAPPR